MKNKLVWIAIGGVIVGLVLVGLGAMLLNRPLGPGLKLTPLASPAAVQEIVTEAATLPAPVTTPSKPLSASPAPVIAPTDTRPPILAGSACGSGVLNLLLLGESSPDPGELRGADAIRLLRIDFDRPAVTILSIPPDLWVKSSALAGSDATSLTRAYWEVKTATVGGEREAIQQATRAIAQALLDNFGYAPNHYLTINQPVVASLVDQLGGIELNVPARIDGSAEGRGIFEAGLQVLNGQRTLDYVRILQPAGEPAPDEWGRFARQNQLISALRSEISQPENAAAMPALVNQFYQLVVTDLSPAQLLDLNCMVDAIGGNIRVLAIGTDMVTSDDQGHMIANGDQIADLLAGMGE